MAVVEEETVAAALARARAAFAAAGIATSYIDAELLIGAAVGLDRVQLRTHSERQLTAQQQHDANGYVARRAAREPVQYILGEAPFRNLMLNVDARVLVPRPETELIVDLVHEHRAACHPNVDVSSPVRVLDVCTGSGAIALAIADESEPGSVAITATDLSADALEVARCNDLRVNNSSDRYDRSALPIEWLHGDLLEPVAGRTFDIIVSNPPYIPQQEAATLDADVRDFEPHIALFVPDANPMLLIRRIAKSAAAQLAPGGLLAIEIGQGQHDAAMHELAAAGLTSVDSRPDLAGIQRIVTAKRAPSVS